LYQIIIVRDEAINSKITFGDSRYSFQADQKKESKKILLYYVVRNKRFIIYRLLR